MQVSLCVSVFAFKSIAYWTLHDGVKHWHSRFLPGLGVPGVIQLEYVVARTTANQTYCLLRSCTLIAVPMATVGGVMSWKECYLLPACLLSLPNNNSFCTKYKNCLNIFLWDLGNRQASRQVITFKTIGWKFPFLPRIGRFDFECWMLLLAKHANAASHALW